MIQFGKDEPVRYEASTVCVIYDPADGRILHMHQVTIFPGGRNPAQPEMEARAFELAKRAGVDVSKAKALHVDPQSLTPGVPHKVDVRSRRVVDIPAGPGR